MLFFLGVLQYEVTQDAAKRQQSDVQKLLCQLSDALFTAVLGVMRRADSEQSTEIFAEQKNVYFYLFPTFSPVMPPPSVPAAERRDLLRATLVQLEETVQEITRNRKAHLMERFNCATARRERLDSVRPA